VFGQVCATTHQPEQEPQVEQPASERQEAYEAALHSLEGNKKYESICQAFAAAYALDAQFNLAGKKLKPKQKKSLIAKWRRVIRLAQRVRTRQGRLAVKDALQFAKKEVYRLTGGFMGHEGKALIIAGVSLVGVALAVVAWKRAQLVARNAREAFVMEHNARATQVGIEWVRNHELPPYDPNDATPTRLLVPPADVEQYFMEQQGATATQAPPSVPAAPIVAPATPAVAKQVAAFRDKSKLPSHLQALLDDDSDDENDDPALGVGGPRLERICFECHLPLAGSDSVVASTHRLRNGTRHCYLFHKDCADKVRSQNAAREGFVLHEMAQQSPRYRYTDVTGLRARLLLHVNACRYCTQPATWVQLQPTDWQ